MGLLDWLLGRKRRAKAPPPPRFGLAELARRLGVTPHELRSVQPIYRPFVLPKRSGGTRKIHAPDVRLKAIQRRLLRRVLGKLKAHPAAKGFERGESIVSNALPHAGKSVVLRMDVKEFFPSTSAARVEAYFRHIGWDAEAAGMLCRLCTHDGGLPQGAPTSPRLSNLVNYALDARLAAVAGKMGCDYTRYADDITLSLAVPEAPSGRRINPKTLEAVAGPGRINDLIPITKRILAEYGYTLHLRKKLQIRRRHQRQQVTGLVVNQHVDLPRSTRRWLRAVEHRIASGQRATLTAGQFEGWQNLRGMILRQSGRAS